MDMMDRAISACEGISQLAQNRQKYNEAFDKARPRCGSCQHWMKSSSCPRERGVMVGGPASDGLPCEKFSGTEQHHKDARAFAAMPRPQ